MPNPWVILGFLAALAGAWFGGVAYGDHQRDLKCKAETSSSVIADLRGQLLTLKNNEILLRSQLNDLQLEKDELEKKGEEYESGLSPDGACPAIQRDLDAE